MTKLRTPSNPGDPVGGTGSASKRHNRTWRWAAAGATALLAGGLVASAGISGPSGPRVLHVAASGGAAGGSCSVAEPCSLAGALHAAVLTGTSTIMIPAGTYTGTLVISQNVTMQGAGPGLTILQGTSEGPAVAVDSGTVTLSDLTITGGKGVDEYAGAGGIDNAGALTLTDVDVTGNTADHDVIGAGGIYNNAGATLDMTGGSVTANTSAGSDTCAGGIANDGTMTLSGVVVSDNTCSGSFVNGVGGIITGAGAFAVRSPSSQAVLSLSDTTLSDNSDTPGTNCSDTGTLAGNVNGDCFVAAGGVIANGATTVTGSTFTGNTAVTAGGGIFASAQAVSEISVSDSTFDHNNGGIAGGAISLAEPLRNSSGPNVAVSDSTFVDNSASGEGGAIDVEGSNGPSLSVVASTFVGDSAPTGGAIDEDVEAMDGHEYLSVAADIFSSTGCYVSPVAMGYTDGFVDGGYNAGTDGTCFAATPATGDVASPAAADLTGLGNFGGPTQTAEPTAGNPAIAVIPATGTAAFAQANGSTFTLCPTTDQRGTASSGACDAGAVQGVYTPPPASPPTTTSPTTTTPTPPPPSLPASYLVAEAGGTTTTFEAATAASEASITGQGVKLAAPIVGATAAPGGGHWLVGADGGVFAVGGAPFDGSLPGFGVHPNAPIVGIAASPGGGYWLAAANGAVYTIDPSSTPQYSVSSPLGLAAPVVGIAAAPGGGYWLVGADGGVFALGGAPFDGSLPGIGTKVSDVTAIAP